MRAMRFEDSLSRALREVYDDGEDYDIGERCEVVIDFLAAEISMLSPRGLSDALSVALRDFCLSPAPEIGQDRLLRLFRIAGFKRDRHPWKADLRAAFKALLARDDLTPTEREMAKHYDGGFSAGMGRFLHYSEVGPEVVHTARDLLRKVEPPEQAEALREFLNPERFRDWKRWVEVQ